MRGVAIALALGLTATAAAGVATLKASTPPREREPERATAVVGPDRATMDAAIAKGVAYLVGAQNSSGSWGSAASNLYDIYAPVPGSYYAFEVAVTALAVSGLMESTADGGPVEPAVANALRRGADFLVNEHRKAKRISPDVLYNVWAHAYVLRAFCRLLDRETDADRVARLRRACDECVDFLERFEFVDGGWGYYNFDIVARRPEHGATTFTTATVLVALKAASERGISVPRRLVRRAIALIQLCRKPDWSFAYSWDHRYFPQGGINKIRGSLARSPACIDALARWGEDVPVERRVGALDDLDRYGYFLRIARKYPQPHESWFQNSGYFCFYGYHYAADLLDLVPVAPRRRYAARIAAALVPLQEPDGSWWDYQLYGYHKAYGTGYVLITLSRCRDERP